MEFVEYDYYEGQCVLRGGWEDANLKEPNMQKRETVFFFSRSRIGKYRPRIREVRLNDTRIVLDDAGVCDEYYRDRIKIDYPGKSDIERLQRLDELYKAPLFESMDVDKVVAVRVTYFRKAPPVGALIFNSYLSAHIPTLSIGVMH